MCHKLTHLIWMCYESVPSPSGGASVTDHLIIWCPRLGSFFKNQLRHEGRVQRRPDAQGYQQHFIGYTVGPKLLHYNPASPRQVTWIWTQSGESASRWIIEAWQIVGDASACATCSIVDTTGTTRGPHRISTGCPANLAILRCSTESSKRRNITLCSCTHLWDHCYPYIFDISITGNVSAVLSVYDCILSLAKHHDTFLNGKITHFHLVVIVENTEIIELYSISYDCCKKNRKVGVC